MVFYLFSAQDQQSVSAESADLEDEEVNENGECSAVDENLDSGILNPHIFGINQTFLLMWS